MAKKAELTQISEFGGTIKQNRPLAPGSPLYLHTFIYENAPGRNLTATVYHCEQSESEKGAYECALLYFGINEAFLKYTRSWIRDNYASLKGKEG